MAPKSSSNKRPLWLVTGASSGIGRAIALEASKFATVIAAGRNVAGLEDARQAGCIPLQLDLAWDEKKLKQSVDDVLQAQGGAAIDVLVNAAGYLLQGACEETNDEELLHVFTTHVFGPLRLSRAVLPQMRKSHAGTIANVSGIGGIAGAPNAGPYTASKAAMTTLTEAFQQELGPLGIRLCLVQLGHFRTSFLNYPGHRRKVAAHIPDYDPTLDPIRGIFDQFDGAQQGDPKKAGKVIVEALTRDEVPTLLPVGPDVPAADKKSHGDRLAAMSQVEAWSTQTDHSE